MTWAKLGNIPHRRRRSRRCAAHAIAIKLAKFNGNKRRRMSRLAEDREDAKVAALDQRAGWNLVLTWASSAMMLQ